MPDGLSPHDRSRRPVPLQRGLATSRLLVGHFLRRLVENDLVSPDADRHEVLAFVASSLVALGTLASMVIAMKYLMRPLQSRGWTAVVALDDTYLWTGFSMLLMACVALAAWDALSLDARDTEVLGILPVRHATIVAAQAGAVALLAFGCALGLNLVPTLVGPIVRVQRLPIGAAGLATLASAHAVATMAAGLLGFLAIVTVREVLRAVLGHRLFARVSGPAQSALVVSVALLLLMLPPAAVNVERRWLATGASAAPPLWFVGLHETISGESLIGIPATDAPTGAPRRASLASAEARLTARYVRHQPAFAALARRAAWSLAAVLAVAIAAWGWNSRRLPPPGAVQSSAGGRPRAEGVRAWLVPSPAMRAGFDFTLQVLSRSAPHRMVVAIAAGVAVAIGAGWLSGPDDAAASASGRVFAAQSLVLFVLAAGLRRAMRQPAGLEASVAFVLAGQLDDGPFREGARRAGIVALALPALMLLFPAQAAILGVPLAAWHGIVGLILWLVVSDVALPSQGVPFVTPGARLQNPVVVGVIVTMTALQVGAAFGWIERIALRSPGGRVALLGTLAATWLGLRLRAARRRLQPASVVAPSTAGLARLNLGE